jgi:UDP-GlcNAc:undecaprenyl-phosphate GlcNAc-1-phosphate transferase
MPDPGRLLAIIAAVFATSAALTAVVLRVARGRGWLALPRPDRWHRNPTPMFGGIAIYLAFVGGMLATVPVTATLLGFLALVTVMFVAGLADDVWELKPQTKVVTQVACALLLYAVGYHFNTAIPWWIDLVVVVGWVVSISNSMNLLDNMNGLAAGTAIIAGVFRLLLFERTGNAEGALASAVFIGAVAGFLVFNFPRAAIFMGDGGSLTIGFALAALNLSNAEGYSKNLFSILVFPVLVLALPIFDTAFVSVVRYFSGRNVVRGFTDHASHRLVAIGLSEPAAVLILWGLSIAGGVAAFKLYDVGFSYAIFAAALLVLGLILFGVVLARVRVYEEGHEPQEATSGFSLPAELLYKRQLLWIFVDMGTMLIAFYGALVVTSAADIRPVPVAVAVCLLTLVARGLYRTDWMDFGRREVGSIAGGTLLGLVAVLLLQIAAPAAGGWTWRAAAFACGSMLVGLCGTRVFVRTLDLQLRRWSGGARRDG